MNRLQKLNKKQPGKQIFDRPGAKTRIGRYHIRTTTRSSANISRKWMVKPAEIRIECWSSFVFFWGVSFLAVFLSTLVRWIPAPGASGVFISRLRNSQCSRLDMQQKDHHDRIHAIYFVQSDRNRSWHTHAFLELWLARYRGSHDCKRGRTSQNHNTSYSVILWRQVQPSMIYKEANRLQNHMGYPCVSA